jgi:hypothetical protein
MIRLSVVRSAPKPGLGPRAALSRNKPQANSARKLVRQRGQRAVARVKWPC